MTMTTRTANECAGRSQVPKGRPRTIERRPTREISHCVASARRSRMSPRGEAKSRRAGRARLSSARRARAYVGLPAQRGRE